MNKTIRLLISIMVVLGLVLVARSQVASAQLPGGFEQSISAEDQSSTGQDVLGHGDDDDDDDDRKGTVKPPPKKKKICKKGVYSVGGGATVRVTSLSKHWCIHAELRKRSHVNGRIPDGAGKLLSDVLVAQVFFKNHMSSYLPGKYGDAQICFAVPHGKQAKIYYLSDSGRKHGTPTWQAISTRVKKGVACATLQYSGAYALIGR